MFTKYISVILLFVLSFAQAQKQAYIFNETFENTSQWHANQKDASIKQDNKSLTFSSGFSETTFESTATILQPQDFVLTLELAQIASNFGIVFKNPEDKDHQIIKFTSEGIYRFDYNLDEKNYYQIKIGNYTPTSFLKITRSNGVCTLSINNNNFGLDLRKISTYQIGIWLDKQRSLTINKIDIVWLGKMISSTKLFEDSEIEKKALSNAINTSGHEVKPTISDDGKTLYFSRKNEVASLLNDDAYQSNYLQNKWSNAEKLTSSFNDLNHNIVSSIINNGQDILVLDQYAAGKKIKDNYRLVHLKEDKLGASSKLKIQEYTNSSSFISACMSSDGKVMILSLKNETSLGGNDLYVSFLKGKTWTKPENLGTNVNTLGNEFSPFLSSDNSKLYFSSNGWPGYGTQDIFVVERKGSWTSWSQPKNLGSKVNNNFWDAYFSITADESLAMVCSNAGVNKGMDIYELRGERRDFTEPLVFKGFIYDSLTLAPISNATLTITDVRSFENTILYQLTTDEKGYFETELTKDLDFDVLVEKQFYNGKKDQIWFKELNSNTVKRNYYLSKYMAGQRIALEQIYFIQGRDAVRDVSKPTIDKLYRILVDNPNIRILIEGHTDNQGDEKKNQELSEYRTIKIKETMIAMGIAADRMETIGYGQERPIAPNDTEFNKRLNRRVEFLIIE